MIASRPLRTAAFAGCLSLLPLWSQAPRKSTPREMFFAGLEVVSLEKGRPGRKQSLGTRAGGTGRAEARAGSNIEVSVIPKSQPVNTFGLRYSLLKVMGLNTQEVPPKTRFRKGDAIRIKVQVNNDGFLYVVHQGSSGTWDLMHPSPGTPKGGNRVVAGEEYLVPHDSLLRFDDRPGIEKLFLIVSREPEATLEKLIFTLSDHGASQRASVRPVPKGTLLAANLEIDNGVITELRKTHTRNLMLEGVEGAPSSTRGDEAVYVVNTSARPDSRVVVDIQLIHQ